MASNMYITLPSNTKDFTQTNKTHSFRVHLPQPVSLEGRWEVALVDVQYPHTWKNVVGGQRVEILREFSTKGSSKKIPVWLRGTVPDGHYNDVDSLLGAIKQGIRDAIREIPVIQQCINMLVFDMVMLNAKGMQNEVMEIMRSFENLSEFWRHPFALDHLRHSISDLDHRHEAGQRQYLQRVLIEYTKKVDLLNMPATKEEQELGYSFIKDTNQLKLTFSGNAIKEVKLPEKLQYMLGLISPNIEKGTTTANYAPDFTGGFTTLYIHCNIVEPQIIGNIRSELLRTVPVNNNQKFGDTVHKLFTSPHYVNVLHKNFDNILVEIRSDEGLPVPFEYGKVIVKLHFRKSKGL